MIHIKRLLLVVTILSLIVTVGCSKEKDIKDSKKHNYYDNSKYIAIDVIASNVLCFDVVFFTDDKVENVEFVGFVGEGIESDSFEVSAINNTIDIYENHEYRDLYCSDWMFECKPNKGVTECIITEMEVKVNGENRKIVFGDAVKYKVGEGNDIFDKELQPYAFANEFPSSIINSGMPALYSYIANKTVVINEVTAGSGLDVDVKVYINDDKTKEYELPLEVEAGTKVDMEITYSSRVRNNFSYVLTNLYTNYSIGEEEFIRKGVIVFNPTSPVDDKLEKIDTYIDDIVGE